MMNEITRIRETVEEAIREQKPIYTHTYQDLDNLMSRFLLTRICPKLNFVYLPAEKLKTLVEHEIVLDFPGGKLDHHNIPGTWSCCKLLFAALNQDNKLSPYARLVDYCHRGDNKLLTPEERSQGSLINVVYALRSNIKDDRLYEVFEHLALKISQNEMYLTGYCDIEVVSAFPDLADDLIKTTVGYTEIMRKYVYFIDIDNKNFIAVNESDHNILSHLFNRYHVSAVVFKTAQGRAGIIVRKGYLHFDLAEIYDALSKDEPNVWVYQKNKIVTRTHKSAVATRFTARQLVDMLIASYKH